jgi:hypothetical protein
MKTMAMKANGCDDDDDDTRCCIHQCRWVAWKDRKDQDERPCGTDWLCTPVLLRRLTNSSGQDRR